MKKPGHQKVIKAKVQPAHYKDYWRKRLIISIGDRNFAIPVSRKHPKVKE